MLLVGASAIVYPQHMNPNEEFYLVRMQEEFSRRQRVNASYSLRAYAADLQMDSSNLSAVFQKKRRLPIKRAATVADKLRLSPLEKNLFIESVGQRTRPSELTAPANSAGHVLRKHLDEEAHYRIIAEWEYYAVLQLLKTADFKSDPEWMAQRLCVSAQRVKVVLERLLQLGFIKSQDGRFVRSVPDLATSEDVESKALQASHRESCELASRKIDAVPVQQREYRSMTLAVDIKNIDKAKALIRDFENRLAELMSSPCANAVYQMNIQFFPLTNTKNPEVSDEK